MINYKLFAVLVFVLISGIYFEEAFAMFTPTQPNAYVSYNMDESEVQLNWDFTTGGDDAPETCLLKGDFWFVTDILNNYGISQSDSNDPTDDHYDSVTYIKGFTPTYYSAVSSYPTLVGTDQKTEVIPCTGNMRIDMDTVMSHESNVALDGVTPRTGVQIFLSFYAVDYSFDLTTFAYQDSTYMDQIFVLYSTPTGTWSTAAKNWACNGEPGNVLYLDGGIHGNNGDKCDVYYDLDSNEYVDIGGDNNGALLDDGDLFWGFHTTSSFSLLSLVLEQIIAIVTNPGGDDDHNSNPTFGLDHKTNAQLVDEGLVINDKVHMVTNNFYTPMDMLHLEVGATQNFTSTVYAPHTLHIMEFGFGIPEVGNWAGREASFDIMTNYDGDELGVEFHQDEVSPIINATSVVYSVSKVKCNANDNTAPCYRVSVEFSFMEAPLYNVFGLQAIDQDRKNQILYFNDGITLEGESQNPPLTQQIISDIKYKGLQTVQRIDKENDIWMTLDDKEPVTLYKQNDHGSFNPLEYRVFESTPDDIKMNMDRLNSNFKDIIQYEQKLATKIFDSKLIQGEDPTYWSYEYPLNVDRMEQLQKAMKYEVERAQLEKVLSTHK